MLILSLQTFIGCSVLLSKLMLDVRSDNDVVADECTNS